MGFVKFFYDLFVSLLQLLGSPPGPPALNPVGHNVSDQSEAGCQYGGSDGPSSEDFLAESHEFSERFPEVFRLSDRVHEFAEQVEVNSGGNPCYPASQPVVPIVQRDHIERIAHERKSHRHHEIESENGPEQSEEQNLPAHGNSKSDCQPQRHSSSVEPRRMGRFEKRANKIIINFVSTPGCPTQTNFRFLLLYREVTLKLIVIFPSLHESASCTY